MLLIFTRTVNNFNNISRDGQMIQSITVNLQMHILNYTQCN